jgi:hypothetical protein
MNFKKFQTSEISAQELVLSQIFQQQYNNIFHQIIHFSQHQFNNLLHKSVFLILNITKKNFPTPLIKKIQNIFEQIYLRDRKEILLNIQKLKNKNQEQLSYLNKPNYYLHCQKQNEALHTCGNCLVYDKDLIYCLFCDEVFKETQIQILCSECNSDYYSKIKKNSNTSNLNLYPASYYHSNDENLNGNIIKCPKCNNELYLDISLKKDFENNIFCNKCNITFDTIETFNCETKLFTGFNKESINELCKINTLIEEKIAIPKGIMSLKCNCDISNINKFNDDCGGILYEGNKNGKKILVCNKCYKIYNYEKFDWTCPLCKNKFKTKELRICRSSYKKKSLINGFHMNRRKIQFNLSNTNFNLNEISDFKNVITTESNSEKKNSSLRKMASHDIFKKNNKVGYFFTSSNKKLHSTLFEFMNSSNGKSSFRSNNKQVINQFPSNNKRLSIEILSNFRYESPSKKNNVLSSQNNCAIKLNMMEKFNQCEKENENNKENNYFNLNSSSTKSGSIENPKKNSSKEDIILLSPLLVNNKNNDLNLQFNSDDYNIISLIGEGSFAKIYLVEHPISHQKYALKKISGSSMQELEQKKKEYELISNLNKTIDKLQIIKILGIQTKKLDKLTFVMYVLMELATCDWEKEIKKRAKSKLYYKEKEIFNILSTLVYSFSELQKRGISHRDVKPQNILLFPNGDYKISDFGEAKKKSNKNFNKDGEYENDTNNQTIRGTELYMSPILFKALRSLKKKEGVDYNAYKNDVFSLGFCILFACTLNYQALYDIRELNDMIKLKEIVFKYLDGKYSIKFINLVIFMINIKEKKRPDFVELDNWIKNNY